MSKISVRFSRDLEALKMVSDHKNTIFRSRPQILFEEILNIVVIYQSKAHHEYVWI